MANTEEPKDGKSTKDMELYSVYWVNRDYLNNSLFESSKFQRMLKSIRGEHYQSRLINKSYYNFTKSGLHKINSNWDKMLSQVRNDEIKSDYFCDFIKSNELLKSQLREYLSANSSGYDTLLTYVTHTLQQELEGNEEPKRAEMLNREINISDAGKIEIKDSDKTIEQACQLVLDNISKAEDEIDGNANPAERSKAFSEFCKKHPVLTTIILGLFTSIIYTMFLQQPTENFRDWMKKEFSEHIMHENTSKRIFEKMAKEVGKEPRCDFLALPPEECEKEQIYIISSKRPIPVKNGASTKCKNISEVAFGDIISVIKRKGRWAMIEYTDATGEVVCGWTYSRYIYRLRTVL